MSATESFDIVITFHILEHLPKRRVSEFLRETWRVLKPGGRLLLATPNRRIRLRPFQPPFNPTHRREYTVAGLRGLLAKYYPTLIVAGLRGTSRVESLEKERVRLPFLEAYLLGTIRRLPAHLRPRWPASRRENIKSLPDRDNYDPSDDFSLKEFYLDKINPERAMVLFAVCRK